MRIDRRAAVKRKLVEAVRQGQPLICSALSPQQLACSRDAEHVIPAEVIRDLLRGRSGEELDPRGVRVSGARITGKLDLDNIECKVGLALQGCWLDQPMAARGARLPWLSLSGSHLPALVADQLQVAGSVDLDQLCVRGHAEEGAVRLYGARIDGDLSCCGAQLDNDTGPALNAEAIRVDGTVFLRDGFCATGCGEEGAVRLRSARIGGRLYCSRAQLDNQSGPALNAGRLQVDGTVQLKDLIATGDGEDGAVRLRGARIGARLVCHRAQLNNLNGPALHANRLQVEGSVHLEQLRAAGHDKGGAVRLFGARISGHLLCSGAQLKSDTGPALNAEAMQVDGTVFLRDGFCATGCGEEGAVRLRGARIGGRLYCTSAQLHNDTGPALQAARLQVEISVQLEELRATGRGKDGAVRLFGARISGDLSCRGAQLHNDTGPALHGNRLQVEGSVHLEELRATGHSEEGAVRLRGARIGTSLEFGKGSVRNPNGPALDLRSASATNLNLPQEVVNWPAEEGSRKGSKRQGTDERLRLDGLTYSTIPEPADLDRWLHLLGNYTCYAAQPYQQLASVYRAVGEEAEVRKILITQQDDLRARGKLGGSWARARHWLLGVTIGYGYQTWRAFVWLVAVLVLAIGLGVLAGHIHGDDRWVAAHTDKAGTAKPGTAKPGTACSTAEQVGLGVERAIPLLISNTGIRERCALDSHSVPGQIITVTGWILQLAAWALAALAIAGYTGLVRKT